MPQKTLERIKHLPKGILPLVHGLLEGKTPEKRALAANALGEERHSAAIPFLEEKLLDEEEHDEVRAAAAEAIGETQWLDSIPTLKEVFDRETNKREKGAQNHYLLISTGEALRKMSHPKAEEALVTTVTSQGFKHLDSLPPEEAIRLLHETSNKVDEYFKEKPNFDRKQAQWNNSTEEIMKKIGEIEEGLIKRPFEKTVSLESHAPDEHAKALEGLARKLLEKTPVSSNGLIEPLTSNRDDGGLDVKITELDPTSADIRTLITIRADPGSTPIQQTKIKSGKDEEIIQPQMAFQHYVRSHHPDYDELANQLEKELRERYPQPDFHKARTFLERYLKQLSKAFAEKNGFREYPLMENNLYLQHPHSHQRIDLHINTENKSGQPIFEVTNKCTLVPLNARGIIRHEKYLMEFAQLLANNFGHPVVLKKS